MKKIIILLLALILLTGCNKLMDNNTNNPNDNQNSSEDTNDDLNIDENFNYKKVNMYVFYGDGCPYCDKLLDFLKQNKDLDKYYNLKTYEVWNNEENKDLMNKMASYLGDTVKGVPYYIIGDTSFNGYNSSYDKKIAEKLEAEYKNSKSVDVYEKVK